MNGERRPARRSGEAETPRGDDFRCCCGSLLARLTPHGVQLKCRRCKRTILVAITARRSAERASPT
jgi:hypothetical protein